jgi:2,5-diketo-D-gluconate reductase A
MFLALQAPEWYREAAVGAALRNSSVDRSDIFLTSKLHPRHHGYESALQQLDKARPSWALQSCHSWHAHWLGSSLLCVK